LFGRENEGAMLCLRDGRVGEPKATGLAYARVGLASVCCDRLCAERRSRHPADRFLQLRCERE
jgi:hypothetical protein